MSVTKLPRPNKKYCICPQTHLSKMVNMITLSTLPVPEIDLSMTLKIIEKL